ncbi:MAG: hypothetical protein IPJ69_15030 [Deltaproteobacteria bacterium]|nr:MAG: hypothetical protein IPJ69_15030 [Deltaproteobacteria bacterium]
MKNTKLMSLVILTSALGWLSIAQANVDEIPFQGYVLQNGTVIDGDKSVVLNWLLVQMRQMCVGQRLRL